VSATAESTEKYVNGEMVKEDDVPQDGPVAHADPSEADDSIASAVEQHDSQLDDIEIQVAHREWVVEGDFKVIKRDRSEETSHFQRSYVQKPLSFTAMLQFTGLIGEKIAEAMAGPEGLTLDGMLNEADGVAGFGRALLTSSDFAGVDSFVKGLAKLATYVPSVIEDCQCIWLRVPYAERPIVKEIWSRSPEDGGLAFFEGQEMLEVFLAQNYDEVEDFFGVRLKRLTAIVSKLRARKAASRESGSRRSRPSSTTPADTQSP
jgi:hypothetical protein